MRVVETPVGAGLTMLSIEEGEEDEQKQNPQFANSGKHVRRKHRDVLGNSKWTLVVKRHGSSLSGHGYYRKRDRATKETAKAVRTSEAVRIATE